MAEPARKINQELKRREKQRGSLTRMCRKRDPPRPDTQAGKLLLAPSKAGTFRLRRVMVGTHAFRYYPGFQRVEVPEAHAVTEDIDVAAFHSVRLPWTTASTRRRPTP
ncbi:MAG: hypothetical protein JNM20_18355 [Rhizobiales bacterium]|nr:hypothetical protein [Hyphomicrobiales bacterium]